MKGFKLYDRMEGFYNGFAIVHHDNKFGFVNEAGIEICELKYDRVWKFNEGYAIVEPTSVYQMGLVENKNILTLEKIELILLVYEDIKHIPLQLQ